MIKTLFLWLAVFLPAVAIPNGTLISLPILAVILFVVKRTRAPTFAMVFRSVPLSLAIGLVAGAAMQFLLSPLLDLLVLKLTGSRADLSSLAGVHGNIANYLMLLALGLIFGGVLEEVINRGYLVGWASAELGKACAVPLMLVSAIGFGLAHAWQGPAGMIVTGVSGLAYGTVYLLCDRKLLPAMMTHATSNFIGITSIYLYGVPT